MWKPGRNLKDKHFTPGSSGRMKFPYLTYHSGNAQVSPAGEVVETGESEFLRKTRIISRT